MIHYLLAFVGGDRVEKWWRNGEEISCAWEGAATPPLPMPAKRFWSALPFNHARACGNTFQ
jgi:hypothetical protein